MPEPNLDLRLEIAHVLFIDIVGYSKLLIDDQRELQEQLNQIVRGTAQCRAGEAEGKLVRLPTGDGMALVFFTSAEAPVQCALEISEALQNHPKLRVRMGINTGPVSGVADVNSRSNVAGAGINVAQRVMDCGDAGHILLSKRAAEDLLQYRQWQRQLRDLGEFELKHGLKVSIVNLYTGKFGNPHLPEKLQQEIRKQIASRRFKRTLIGGVLLLAVALPVGSLILLRRTLPKSGSPTTAIPAKRIAVLPFKPVLPANRDEVLELGMADTLITKLSSSRQAIVSSLTAVRKYAGLDQDSVAAGRALQVNSVLEGNVQKVGDRIRVTARLINVADGSSVWADTFDEKLTDVFAVQDAISQKVADALALRLTGDEQKRLTKRYTDNLEAYQLYLTGRYHWSKFTPSELREAIGFFRQAMESDPNYALAYFGFAEANRSLTMNADVASKDCLPQAKAAAEKALAIDDSLAEAHASLSFSLAWFDWDWAGAEREAKRAIALNPNSAHAHFSAAHVLSDLGRHDEAIAEIGRARELDPVFPLYRTLEGLFLHNANRNDEAGAKLEKVLELDPNLWITHLILGRVFTQQRKYPEAIAQFSQARDFSHGNSEAIAAIGYVEALAGDKTEARRVLDELNKLSAQRYISPYNFALLYSGLGERDEAFSWLGKACEDRDVRLNLLKVDPRWDSLRSDARFIAILKRIGLE